MKHGRLPGRFQQLQGGTQHRTLFPGVADRSDRTSHQERGQEHPRKGHFAQRLLEGGHGDDYGGYPGLLHQAGDMSHGHVAHRSDRYQQGGIHRLRRELPHPGRTVRFQQAGLGTGPYKAVDRIGKLAENPLGG